MNLDLDLNIASEYKSLPQKIRVMSEAWVLENVYCPTNGLSLKNYKNNKPVADFYCKKDNEDFELKAKKSSFGRKIVDGAYETMIDRLNSNSNPNLFLMSYNPNNFTVKDFVLIPKHFFTSNIIEKRSPLSQSARRSGWVGCNILIENIPNSGLIFYVKSSKVKGKESVIKKWRKTLFLREEKNKKLKGWILEVMKCIESLNKKKFTLKEMYSFEKQLKNRYPDNSHIKAKIRQQLQFLRDKDYIEFLGKGKYKLIT